MRIALLSAVRPATNGGLAALSPFLGRTVLAAQFDRACELGAERIVCLASVQAAEILSLQHEAEQRNVDFHLISGHLALAGLLVADHELIVFQDGVLIDRLAIASEISNECGILVVPAEAGVSIGLERIDATWAWGGLLISRADVAEKLADLPSDSDTASLLLRLALQARVPLSALGADHLSAGTIMRIDDAEALAKREAVILNNALHERSWAGPGTKLAGLAVKAMLPKALGWGGGLTIAGTVLAIGAVTLAAFGQATIGGLLLVFAAFLFAKLNAIDALLVSLDGGPQVAIKSNIFNVMFDLSIVTVLSLSLWPATWTALALVPIAIGLIRVAGLTALRCNLPMLQDFWQDRVFLTLGLTVGMFWDAIVPILATLALAMLAFALICEEGKANLRST